MDRGAWQVTKRAGHELANKQQPIVKEHFY